MVRRSLKNEAGYSLVEVMAAIVILTVAIIPIVGMFDAALKSTGTSGDYDKARALAGQQLERAKSLSYEDARDEFPAGSSTPNPTYTSSSQTAGVPSGFASYTVEKRFIDEQLADSPTDEGMMKVTVNWSDNKSYKTTGVVGR